MRLMKLSFARITMGFAAVVLAPVILVGQFTTPASAATEKKPEKHVEFSFEGPFGTFDRAALQRGYQVYKEVCSACHSMRLISFRNLAEPGGPGFTMAEAKALAASYKFADLDDKGEPTERPGLPSDRFPKPFPNDLAAKAANNGALPPDLSLMAKAREGGPHYIYSLVSGYDETPPPDVTVADGLYYNPYFPGGQVAMPQPLSEGVVTYADGTPATVPQMAKDVATFLMWTAEPRLEERHELGFKVMIFLFIFAGLLYLSYRRLWAGIAH
jgi:cytochrome c1